MTTQEYKAKIKAEITETKEMFEMGLLTPQERFARDYESKERLRRFYKLSK